MKNEKTINLKVRLSTLWIVVMFTMAFADIMTLVLPEALNDMMQGTTQIKITQELLLLMAVFVQLPILMIYFSRTLSYKANRLINIIAAIVTILFVVEGGSMYLHYIFFAAVEVVCLLMIICYSWKWKPEE
jgi:hypothetical protein